MPIFNLLDVTVQDSKRNLSVASSSNYVGDYSTNAKRYPIDLGTSSDKGHYMVFHINVQKKTSYDKDYEYSSDEPTIFASRARQMARTGNDPNIAGFTGALADLGIKGVETIGQQVKRQISKAVNNSETLSAKMKEYAGGTIDVVAAAAQGATDTVKEARSNLTHAGFMRTIRRTKDTIALYMPDTLAFTQEQKYGSVEFGGGLLAAGAAGASALNRFKGMPADKLAYELGRNATPFLAAALQDPKLKALAAGAFGTVINPQLEMVYTAPDFRSFSFEFMFYPRSQREALDVLEIIRLFKFHQAPEVLSSKFAGGVGGFFLVPPSEFDIQFYYNGRENPNIPRISTCALLNMSVDYSPNGFATYETLSSTPTEGGTGMPVAMRLTLQFKELEILTKSNFEKAKNTTNGIAGDNSIPNNMA
jgi:hypothetical protein